jgi:hypothetical protein
MQRHEVTIWGKGNSNNGIRETLIAINLFLDGVRRAQEENGREEFVNQLREAQKHIKAALNGDCP